jgi:uncharacterized protein
VVWRGDAVEPEPIGARRAGREARMRAVHRRSFRACSIAFSLGLASFAARAEPPDEKTALVREIIRVTGAEQIGAQMSASLLHQLAQSYPDVTPDVWTELAASLDPVEATELMVPVYAQHFSTAELRELLGFYTTPLGQKVVREMPAVLQESTAIGSEWGRRKREDLVRRLTERGYRPKEI